MARYLSEEQAAADGITIVHEPERQRYALYSAQPSHAADGSVGGSGPGSDPAQPTAPRLVGEAHYSLLGDDLIDFDHTVVSPKLRGTGLSGLLARRALTGDIVQYRRIAASCWFIAGYLDKHPELRGSRN